MLPGRELRRLRKYWSNFPSFSTSIRSSSSVIWLNFRFNWLECASHIAGEWDENIFLLSIVRLINCWDFCCGTESSRLQPALTRRGWSLWAAEGGCYGERERWCNAGNPLRNAEGGGKKASQTSGLITENRNLSRSLAPFPFRECYLLRSLFDVNKNEKKKWKCESISI